MSSISRVRTHEILVALFVDVISEMSTEGFRGSKTNGTSKTMKWNSEMTSNALANECVLESHYSIIPAHPFSVILSRNFSLVTATTSHHNWNNICTFAISA